MNTQGNVNQLLGLSATALRLGPDFERKQQLRDVNKKIKGYQEQTSALSNSRKGMMNVKEFNRTAEELGLDYKDDNNKLVEAIKEKFEIDPTRENLEKYHNLRKTQIELQDNARQRQAENADKMMRMKAERILKIKGSLKVRQKDAFNRLMERLKKPEGGYNE